MFGLASVAGPLLGGVIVEHASWRWVFYVNLPIGLVALVVLAATLPAGAARGEPVIDYLGAGLLASGLSAIVLVTSLGGTTWAWGSARGRLHGAARGGSRWSPSRSSSAGRPSRCCRPRCGASASSPCAGALSLIVGFALFGAVTFLPLYFQTVDARLADRIGAAAGADDARACW